MIARKKVDELASRFYRLMPKEPGPELDLWMSMVMLTYTVIIPDEHKSMFLLQSGYRKAVQEKTTSSTGG